MTFESTVEEEMVNIEVKDIETGKWLDNYQAHARVYSDYVYVDRGALERQGFYFPHDSKLQISSISGKYGLRLDVKLNRFSRYYIVFEVTAGKETIPHEHVQVKPFYSVTLPTTGGTTYVSGTSAGGTVLQNKFPTTTERVD